MATQFKVGLSSEGILQGLEAGKRLKQHFTGQTPTSILSSPETYSLVVQAVKDRVEGRPSQAEQQLIAIYNATGLPLDQSVTAVTSVIGKATERILEREKESKQAALLGRLRQPGTSPAGQLSTAPTGVGSPQPGLPERQPTPQIAAPGAVPEFSIPDFLETKQTFGVELPQHMQPGEARGRQLGREKVQEDITKLQEDRRVERELEAIEVELPAPFGKMNLRQVKSLGPTAVGNILDSTTRKDEFSLPQLAALVPAMSRLMTFTDFSSDEFFVETLKLLNRVVRRKTEEAEKQAGGLVTPPITRKSLGFTGRTPSYSILTPPVTPAAPPTSKAQPEAPGPTKKPPTKGTKKPPPKEEDFSGLDALGPYGPRPGGGSRLEQGAGILLGR